MRRTPSHRTKKAQVLPDLRDPKHWIGPRWLGIYRNADDPRLFVRVGLSKRINFAHQSARWFIALIAGLILAGYCLGLMNGMG